MGQEHGVCSSLACGYAIVCALYARGVWLHAPLPHRVL